MRKSKPTCFVLGLILTRWLCTRYTDEERALFDKAAALLPGFKETIIALYDHEDPDIYGLFL